MVTIVKHEWHQVDSQYELDFDENLLATIYPDLTEAEITDLLVSLKNGNVDLDDLVHDAIGSDIELDWNPVYDDWWTSRKGGFDVTYELGEQNG